MIYIGLDISKHRIDVQILKGEDYERHEVVNDAEGWQKLITIIKRKRHKKVHICCEYTGSYYFGAAVALAEAGYDVSVVNPLTIKQYALQELTRNKTDSEDAKLIARYCKVHKPPLWQAPTEASRRIRQINRRIEQLTKMHVAEQNRQKEADEDMRESHATLLRHLAEEIAMQRKKLQELIAEDADLRGKFELMQTIPGIGEITASALLSPLASIERFPSAKHFVSYLGLSPYRRESGDVRRRGKLSKMGDRYLRKMLYMPARSACLRSRVFRDWAREMMQTRHPKVVYSIMMRKLATYAYKIIKENQPFNPELALKH
ncbi:IS110 family transposase [uncultured Cardiobacterium sp.]|uniref:IS110 family transposase n=1 Tax=uncultured Cardiobacterium sp. TaxID=417619 RepID=UPI0026034430|nr:IS110 family transposase [uncultured Cardiobacterium sp.]